MILNALFSPNSLVGFMAAIYDQFLPRTSYRLDSTITSSYGVSTTKLKCLSNLLCQSSNTCRGVVKIESPSISSAHTQTNGTVLGGKHPWFPLLAITIDNIFKQKLFSGSKFDPPFVLSGLSSKVFSRNNSIIR